MFLPVEGYEWDWDEEDYVYNDDIRINPAQIVKIKRDTLFEEGDYTSVTLTSGEEIIVLMTVDEFETLVRMQQIRPLHN